MILRVFLRGDFFLRVFLRGDFFLRVFLRGNFCLRVFLSENFFCAFFFLATFWIRVNLRGYRRNNFTEACLSWFMASDRENSLFKQLLVNFFQFLENSRRRGQYPPPWAPGAPGVVADVKFVICNFENPPITKSQSIFLSFLENSWRRGWYPSPWAPGALGVVADVKFVIRNLENIIKLP